MRHPDQDRGVSEIDRDALATAGERDIEGRDRDLAADVRDREAEQRDREAEARDDAAGDFDRTAGDRAASNRRRAADEGARADSGRAEAADSRVRAINDRKVAADDRAQGSHDRQIAAEDRAQAAKDREDSGTDELTGTSRRGAGLAAIGREINRAQRVSGELVAAYVDVDGLKATNDATGHAAGDVLLIAVADSLRACLRSYDVITRVGGDEFVCVLPGIAVEHAHRRFEAVSVMLAAGRPGASITVGFARLQAGDSADDLIQRADDEASRVRRRR
jgi:diguanylate cyclase (GGDEF)-like protein